MSERTLDLISKNDVRWVDLRFTDTKGKEQHVSIPATAVDEDFFEGGKMFDGIFEKASVTEKEVTKSVLQKAVEALEEK